MYTPGIWLSRSIDFTWNIREFSGCSSMKNLPSLIILFKYVAIGPTTVDASCCRRCSRRSCVSLMWEKPFHMVQGGAAKVTNGGFSRIAVYSFCPVLAFISMPRRISAEMALPNFLCRVSAAMDSFGPQNKSNRMGGSLFLVAITVEKP